MRKVYRYEDNNAYWDRRWSEAGHDKDKFDDLSIYPVRYAEMIMKDHDATALEIGCGLGRVLKHYHNSGYKISGMERSKIAVDRLHNEDPALDVIEADVMDLPYENDSFDVIMAFGVFHNLENGIEQALIETSRCLKPGGQFCISMRPDNIEMSLNEYYWGWKQHNKHGGKKQFHKLLVREKEFSDILLSLNLVTNDVYRARNVSLLYRLPFLRSNRAGDSNEEKRRAIGYRLNIFGRCIDKTLTTLFPYQMANVLVYVGRKV